jgi:hypothetical protein
LYAHETERDPHEDIVRLEEHIEELDAKIETCRKFILASRIAMAAGGIVLAAMAPRCSSSCHARIAPSADDDTSPTERKQRPE